MHTTPNGKKRVLLAVTKSNMGGAQKYTFDLASHLPKEQLDVAVAAGGNGALFKACESQGVRTIRLPHLDRDISIFKEVKAFFALLKILREEKPDVIHLNSPKMGGLGGLAARFAGIEKIIYTNHGWTFYENRPWWHTPLIKFFSWMIVMLSTTTVLLSKKEYADVENWPAVKEKLLLIPLGITEPSFIERDEAKKRLFYLAGIPDQGQELLYSIGELTGNKGYTYALQALKHYSKPFVYFIAGTGELKTQLEKEISDAGLESKVVLLGFVENAAQYMKGCDRLLLPSIKEGLPYVLLEAGFAKVPVISTCVGGVADIVENHAKNLVPPKDSQAFHTALEHENTSYISTLPLDTMVQKTLELYV